MDASLKMLISKEVAELADKLSQQKVAIKSGVSAATINHIINGKWDLIRADIWYKVQSALRIDPTWNHASTENYENLMQLLSKTQRESLSIAISMKEGRSKSHTYRRYERQSDNVIYVECKNYWTKKTYVQALLKAAGLNQHATVGELIENLISHARSQHQPMMIIDQIDKLKDPQLDLFMDFYNDLEGHCAFVLSGVPALEKRILRGVQRDRIGYREMYSRIGRKFISLPEFTLDDVRSVCSANGIIDEDTIVEIFNESERDMRRVRREIVKKRLLKTA